MSHDGYHGRPTSTVDWCEMNYEFSIYFQEMFNTMSNFAYILPALFGVVQARKGGLPLRFTFLWLSLFLVGFGSFLFHATLSRFSQHLDEYSMLLGISLYFYGVSEDIEGHRQYPLLVPGLATFLSASFISMVVLEMYPNLFRSIFIGMLFVVLFRFFVLHKETHFESVRFMIKAWVCLWLAAGAMWIVDVTCCDYLSQFRYPWRAFLQLHAVWHILTGAASYISGLLVEFVYLYKNGSHLPAIAWRFGGLVPVVVKGAEKPHMAKDGIAGRSPSPASPPQGQSRMLGSGRGLRQRRQD